MEYIQNLVEYFDELYPVTDTKKKFYEEIAKSLPAPTKVLSVGANTGNLEFFLAKQGCDVTGIENFPPLLEAANLKRRSQLLSIRFFTLPQTEIARYLGKKFYNIINVLDNNIAYNSNKQTIENFFSDLHKIISDDGVLIIQLFNFDLLIENSSIDLPVKSSMRAKLFTKICNKDGKTTLSSKLQTWNDRQIPIIQDGEIYPLSKDEIEKFAKKAGFNQIDFYSDFQGSPLNDSSLEIVAVIR